MTCLDFFTDMEVEISEWISDINESEKTKNILRLWFALLKPYNQQKWTQFPTILDEEVFYPHAKMVLLNDATKLGKRSINISIIVS